METTFALVAIFQVYENYSFNADGSAVTGNSAHWKAKGGEEFVVADGLSVDDVAEMGQIGGESMVRDCIANNPNCPGNNEYFQHSLIDWEYCERSEAVVSKVLEIVEAGQNSGMWDNDYCYFVYSAPRHGMTEQTMEWALNLLSERGLIIIKGEHLSRYIEMPPNQIAA